MGNSESSSSSSSDDDDDTYGKRSRQPAASRPPAQTPERATSSTRTNYHHHRAPDRKKKQHSAKIADNFNALDEVINALREAGLESSNLILGIDFSKSNEWTGKFSFNRRSLHAIGGNSRNPYEQAISIIGRTLSPFDEDNLIPCFGFGDATTRDQYVFSFYPDHRPCNGFEEVLERYKEILPRLNLSGPTSFAPVIDAALDIVEKSNFQYHILVIIADGQVTRSADTLPGKLSPQEQATVNSIVAASEYPLSIILVGVGDGPWDGMQEFDDNIPQRAFDNFQFVNFRKIMSGDTDTAKKESAFALASLMEIPLQYQATLTLQCKKKYNSGRLRKPLPPPRAVIDHDNAKKYLPQVTSSVPIESGSSDEQVRPICLTNPKDMAFGCGHLRKPLPPPRAVIDHDKAKKSLPQVTSSVPIESGSSDEQVCPICLTNPKDMAFGCGHLICKDCGSSLSLCHMCRQPITTRLRLYG